MCVAWLELGLPLRSVYEVLLSLSEAFFFGFRIYCFIFIVWNISIWKEVYEYLYKTLMDMAMEIPVDFEESCYRRLFVKNYL